MNEKKILLSIACATLVASAGFGWGIWTTLGSIAEMETVAEEKRQDIAAARSKVEEVRKLEDRVVVLRESVATLASVLPAQKDVEDFVTQVSGSRGENGVKILDFKPTQSAASGKTKSKVFEKIGYQVKVRGSLWQFFEFLNRIESFKRFVMVPRLKITGGKRENAIDAVTHSVEFDVETFSYNPARGTALEPIPNYDKRKELLREEIELATATIEQPPVEWPGDRGRRDIFIDPRISGGENSGGTPLEEQTALLASLRQRIDEVAALANEIETAPSFLRRFELRSVLDEKMPSLEADVAKAEKEGIVSAELLKRTFRNEVVDALARVRKSLSNQPLDQGPSARELAEVVLRARESLAGGHIREAIDTARPVLDKASVIERDALRAPFVAELRQIEHEARVAQRFEEKNIVIGGVIIDVRRKVAVVNGRTIEPGDLVDDDLVVADIFEDGVTFVLEDVQITKKW